MNRRKNLAAAAVALSLALLTVVLAAPPPGLRSGPLPAPSDVHRTVAIMVFDGVQIIDFSAPYEVFGQAGYTVFTVGPTPAPVTTSMGLRVVPNFGFANAPASDVVVFPGGWVNPDDAPIVDWVRRRSAQSQVVLSVCNGAWWLARAGLLDGLRATTFHRALDNLQALAPTAHVVHDKRWVDNGRIVTAAGLSSGIEGALHVVEKLSGETKAREVALNLEYDWRRDSTWARANLADRYLGRDGRVDLGAEARFERLSSLGDADHWRQEGRVTTALAPEAVAQRFDRSLAAGARWAAAGPTRSAAGVATRQWTFQDDQGRPWSATLRLAPGGAAGELRSTLEWSRDGVPAPAAR